MNTLELIDSRIRILEADLEEAKRKKKRCKLGGATFLIVLGVLFVILGVLAMVLALLLIMGLSFLSFIPAILWLWFLIGGGAVMLLGFLFWGIGAHLRKKRKAQNRELLLQIESLEARLRAYKKQREIVLGARNKRRLAKQKIKKLRKMYFAGKIGPKEYIRRKEALLDE